MGETVPEEQREERGLDTRGPGDEPGILEYETDRERLEGEGNTNPGPSSVEAGVDGTAV